MHDRNADGGPVMSSGPSPEPEHSSIVRQLNEGGSAVRETDAEGALADTLAQLGIVSVHTTMFEWGGYRYTNASDAIVAAKRATR